MALANRRESIGRRITENKINIIGTNPESKPN
jgi:hypothetical protein